MTVFASKEAFASLGLEHVKPSHAHASQDCSICLDPLALHPSHATTQVSRPHTAVRIAACGHILGKDCLNAWLDVGYTCPTCNRMLVEAAGDPITQQDVNNVLHELSQEYGKEQILAVVARLMVRQEQEHARLRQLHAEERAKETQARNDGLTMSDEDFRDSDEEMDFGGDDDDLDYGVENQDTSESTE